MVGGIAGLVFFALLGAVVLTSTSDSHDDTEEQFSVFGSTIIALIAIMLVVAFLIGSAMNYGD